MRKRDLSPPRDCAIRSGQAPVKRWSGGILRSWGSGNPGYGGGPDPFDLRDVTVHVEAEKF